MRCFIGLAVLTLTACSTVNGESVATTTVPQEDEVVSTQQTEAPCTSQEYRHFDFWLGEWEVTTPDGAVAGTNSIKKMLNGCAIYERWTASNGYRGDSINFYDQVKRQWHQTWIDYAGNALYGNGGLIDGSMVLEGPGKNQSGEDIINKITWTPNTDGSVRQHWQVSTNNRKSWTTVFDGLYRKTKYR